MGLPDLLDALDLLHADVEEADARALDAEERARHGGAHQREVGELAGGGTDVGAEIEHDAVVARRVGHWPAMAGRSMPGMVRRTSLAMAIRAPVLPAETATSASPFCTASSASHMLEPRPRRTAWLGLSCISMAMSVCTMRERAASAGMRVQVRLDARLDRPRAGSSTSGWRSSASAAPGHDDGGTLISAHGVERYRARRCHAVFALL